MNKLMAFKLYLKKFPLPLNIHEFQAFRYGPKVIANSMPKGGTHLLTRILSLLPLLIPRWHYHIVSANLKLPEELPNIRKGQYISTHLYWSQELINALNTTEIRTLFIIRDLRDVVVSRAYYLTHMLRGHPLDSYLNSLSDSEQLMAAIVGVEGYGIMQSIGNWARGYMPWLDEQTCLTIRFEDLIGSSGGGSDEKQIETVRAILFHLNIQLSENQIQEIANKAFFNKVNTFRKGQIGDWENHFTEEHKQTFKEIAGEALIKLGYTNGYEW
ncbi:MAG TPA: hypothetical protein DD379_05505 [Cyanobacteria bacterium UBA11162]|nr:hypothetical protein [Cyanobacteria bacterium UBA11162]